MKTIIYFADPMCSWCWGFTPVLEKIKQEYQDEKKVLRIALILGGLKPGETEPMPAAQRDEVLNHWKEVEKMTSQPFKIDSALPPGFIYDTEPAAKSVIAFALLDPENLMAYFKRLQEAFYAEALDITKLENLVKIAGTFGMDRERFVRTIHSDDVHKRALNNFMSARKYGMITLPSTVMQDETDVKLLSSGYCTWFDAKKKIDAWLERSPA